MKLLFFILFIIIISQLVHIYTQNQVDSENIDVKRLQTTIEKMENANEKLRIQVLLLESYISIASRASQLGFTQNNEIFIVK